MHSSLKGFVALPKICPLDSRTPVMGEHNGPSKILTSLPLDPVNVILHCKG